MPKSGEGNPDRMRGSGEPEDVAVCPVCRSLNVHPSRSSYPMDAERLDGRGGAFWRCQNCGDRFLGPFAPESHPSGATAHSGHAHRRHHHHRHGKGGRLSLDRWIVPIIALLTGAALLMFLLDNRAPAPRPRVVAPR